PEGAGQGLQDAEAAGAGAPRHRWIDARPPARRARPRLGKHPRPFPVRAGQRRRSPDRPLPEGAAEAPAGRCLPPLTGVWRQIGIVSAAVTTGTASFKLNSIVFAELIAESLDEVAKSTSVRRTSFPQTRCDGAA